MMFSKKKERHKTIEEVARALWRPSKPPLMQDQRTDPVAQHLVQMSVISPNTEIPHAPWPHVPEFGHPLCTTYILNLTKLPLVAICSNSRSVQYKHQILDEYRKSITLNTLITNAVLPRDRSSSTWVNWPVKTGQHCLNFFYKVFTTDYSGVIHRRQLLKLNHYSVSTLITKWFMVSVCRAGSTQAF